MKKYKVTTAGLMLVWLRKKRQKQPSAVQREQLHAVQR
jgi:hypothetical protein